MSPSGKAAGSGPAMRGFESLHPSQFIEMCRNDDIIIDAETLYAYHSECESTLAQADFILVLGSHDLRVAEHAARLFLGGYAPLLVCSGGLGKVTSELWTRPEAEIFAARCRKLGVPQESIILETKSKNTGENFAFSKMLLAEESIFPKTGIAVCKPYMARRAWATGAKQWPEVEWHPSVPPLSFRDYLSPETPLDETINLMVGDLQRLRVYAECGFQVPVAIPATVWAAYERLVADGYDKYVI